MIDNETNDLSASQFTASRCLGTGRYGQEHSRQISRFIWKVGRLPILLALVLLQPIAAVLLGGMALLGLLATLFFKLIAAPHFPMGSMLAVSISFALALMLYEGAIRLLSD